MFIAIFAAFLAFFCFLLKCCFLFGKTNALRNWYLTLGSFIGWTVFMRRFLRTLGSSTQPSLSWSSSSAITDATWFNFFEPILSINFVPAMMGIPKTSTIPGYPFTPFNVFTGKWTLSVHAVPCFGIATFFVAPSTPSTTEQVANARAKKIFILKCRIGRLFSRTVYFVRLYKDDTALN